MQNVINKLEELQMVLKLKEMKSSVLADGINTVDMVGDIIKLIPNKSTEDEESTGQKGKGRVG